MGKTCFSGALAGFCLFLAGAVRAQDAAAVSFWDQRASVRLLVIAADAGTIATVGTDALSPATVWDPSTLKRKGEVSDLPIEPRIALSPDGRLLAAGGEVLGGQGAGPRPAVMLWDLTAGKKRHTIDLPDDSQVRHLAFGSDGKHLAVACSDGSVTFWDPATGKQHSQVKVGEMSDLAFAPNLRALAVLGNDRRTIGLWDAATGKKQRVLALPRGGVGTPAFSPDGKALAAGIYRGTAIPGELWLWDAATGRRRATWKGDEDAVAAVAFSPDGRTLASASSDGLILRWEVASGKQAGRFEGVLRPSRLAFWPDGKLLAAVDEQGGAQLWDLVSGRERLSPAEEKERDRREAIYRRHRERQERARLARQDAGRAPGGAEAHSRRAAEYALLMGQAQLAWEGWQFREAKELFEAARTVGGDRDLRGLEWYYLRQHLPREVVLHERETDREARAAVSPRGETVALVLADAEGEGYHVSLIDANSGKKLGDLRPFKRPVSSLTFSPDGQTLATAEGGVDETPPEIRLWDVARRRPCATLRGHSSFGIVAFAPNGRALGFGGDDGSVWLWDVPSGRLRHPFRAPKTPPVRSLAFSPDGRILAAGVDGQLTRLWDIASGKETGTLLHLRGAEAIAFAPFTHHLATSHGRTVALWDLATRKPVCSFPAPEGPLHFVNGGQHLLCGLALFEPLTGRARAHTDRYLIPPPGPGVGCA